jgi:hypothetical protein
MAGNDLLVGWKQIAVFLSVSERSIRGYRNQLLEGGQIFYRRRRMGKRIVCAWADDLRQWAKQKHAGVTR